MRGPVVLTMSAGSFPGLVERLRAFPAAVEERPLLHFAPPDDRDRAVLDAALDATVGQSATESGGRYAAIALTSPRAAQAFADRVKERKMMSNRLEPEASLRRVEIWAAGTGTARPLADVAPRVRMPSEAEVGRCGAAAALADAMLEAGTRGRVLFPCGNRRHDELPARLRDGGVEVDEVVCYRSVLADEDEARAAAASAAVIVVASPSVAALLARAYPSGARPALVAVGPTTAAASRAAGWPAAAVAQHATAEAISTATGTLLV